MLFHLAGLEYLVVSGSQKIYHMLNIAFRKFSFTKSKKCKIFYNIKKKNVLFSRYESGFGSAGSADQADNKFPNMRDSVTGRNNFLIQIQ